MKRWFGKQLGRQLRKPQGFWGNIVAKLMNYGNKPMYNAAYASLDLVAHNQVLEIGFANGAHISDIIKQVEPGNYAGIDHSLTMVSLASRKNASLINAKRVQLIHTEAGVLQFADNSFDKVFTVNTIYFWEQPHLVMQEVKRVLLPGGRFVIALATSEAMKESEYVKEEFKLYERPEVEALFFDAGFTQINATYTDLKFEDVLCVSGYK